jgi:hypothetical protein
MRDIEINSDKTTVLGVLFVLAFALIVLIANLYGLLVHRPAALPRLDFGLFGSAFFLTCLAVSLCCDSKIRRAYPYGVAGLCLYASSLLVAITMQWAKASVATQNLLGTPMTVLNIVASGLILGEGIRWFRANVKLAKDVTLLEEKRGSEPHV